MAVATDQIVRRIESTLMDMEAQIGVLRQHVVALGKLYERVEKLPLSEPVVDRGGPAGRVDR